MYDEQNEFDTENVIRSEIFFFFTFLIFLSNFSVETRTPVCMCARVRMSVNPRLENRGVAKLYKFVWLNLTCEVKKDVCEGERTLRVLERHPRVECEQMSSYIRRHVAGLRTSHVACYTNSEKIARWKITSHIVLFNTSSSERVTLRHIWAR